MSKMFESKSAAIAALTKIEKAEEGYLEKKSPDKLYSKKENAGYNNYTKYWRDLAKEGLMGQNSTFSGGPAWYWCAGLQSWCFIEAFGKENAKKLLLHLPYTSCATLGDLAAKHKQLGSTPHAGDIVLFWNGSRFSHTGYVYKVEGGKFHTVEGNTNGNKEVVANGGGVFLKSYVTSTYKKKGAKFFTPDYSIVVDKKKANKTSTKKPASGVTAKKITVTVNTKTNPLNCRKSASKTSAAIGKFAKGTKLTVINNTNKNFYKVKGIDMTTKKEITGYCAAEYLK